ncbi:YcjF family protein [Roseibium sediminicola]|uniref:YcjF family protein n=1 Tax=Roseibium sediminicola TaxID=2933272 RepID=A0ABT0H1H1_9HYPH|nr:YcjF family protein [Roseibium sp. CAU 1639]MCK7615315.1 YcjF family protein [Roseibium sp. CAU 1639]
MTTKSTRTSSAKAGPSDSAEEAEKLAESTQQSDTADMSPEERTQLADKVIRDHVIVGTGTGLIPIPIFDLVAAIGTQLNLIRKLAKVYDVPFSENRAKTAVTALLGSLGGVGAGTFIASSLMKTVPVLGTALGIAGSGATLGAFTFAVGKVFQQHFESGGDILNFDVAAYKDHFRKMVKKGETVSEEKPEAA